MTNRIDKIEPTGNNILPALSIFQVENLREEIPRIFSTARIFQSLCQPLYPFISSHDPNDTFFSVNDKPMQRLIYQALHRAFECA